MNLIWILSNKLDLNQETCFTITSKTIKTHFIWKNGAFVLLGSRDALTLNHQYRRPGNPYWRSKISTVDLLVLTSSDQLLLIQEKILFFKTSFLNEEVNRTELSPSVRVPCRDPPCFWFIFKMNKWKNRKTHIWTKWHTRTLRVPWPSGPMTLACLCLSHTILWERCFGNDLR